MNVWYILRLIGHVLGGLGLLIVLLSLSGVLLAPSWGLGLALILMLPTVLMPLQPFVTGNARMAVSDTRRFRQGLSLRLVFAFLPGAFLLAGTGLMVFALARPMEIERRVERTNDGLDILLAIDTSCSMEASDLSGRGRSLSRLEVAKGVVNDFIEGRPDDRIGVVVFGEDAFTHVPLTLDHDTLQSVLQQVQIGVAGARGTAIGTAINVGSKRLLQVDNPERVIILLTDGQNNAGRYKPLEAANNARDLNIRIYTIGVGSGGGLTGAIFGMGSGGLDERTLTEIAQRTGGAYFRATSADALRRVYETIDQLERSPAEVEEDVEPHDWYRFALFPGLILLFLHILLTTVGLRRWP